jgi:hypothetical protein
VGLFLDVSYSGGLKRDFVGCAPNDDPFIAVSLDTPNGATYSLEAPEGGICGPGGGGILLAPGSRVRLYFQGWVPANLSSIRGSKVRLDGRVWGTTKIGLPAVAETFDDTLELNQGSSFRQASIGNMHRPGEAIKMKDVTAGILSVSYDRDKEQHYGWGLAVEYRLTNDSPYDFIADWSSGTTGILIDARGYPYQLRQMEECHLPPGYTKDCALEGERYIDFDQNVYADSGPDLSDALIVLSLGDDLNTYAFHWP